ncbi:hypothetical protein M413DRAFT_439700 [Hebeloma cylindrosporum]|uniref:Autophagy-related protein 16 domain-containing protein n=1 Tax=Hebeloma cylindrosporum TaxID=76867 RepID=A0A0C3CV46_HEBCY|nr:hypothetical protein M413DRAFT_439700 [Hebeloma cylindrosporum h7]
MAEPSWQELLRLRLAERNSAESAFAPIIEQYRRLAQQTKLLKERNATLLRAVGSVKGNPSTVGSSDDNNPVRAAYLASLETQISSLRDELANLYKTQGQNAQRLLSMNETLREKEELSRIDSENLRKLRDEVAALRRKVDQHAELMAEKDRTVQSLSDEISTSLLELGQIEERNQILAKDNAKLLQRWLDAKQVEANRMNEANEFYENMRSRHETVLSWREGSTNEPPHTPNLATSPDSSRPTSGSGKGSGGQDLQAATTRNGHQSPIQQAVDLTPNG